MAISISPGGPPLSIPTGSPFTGTFGGGVRVAPGQSLAQTVGGNQQTSESTARSLSQSYIPDYAESPILRSIATQAQSMAPQVYQWGMEQYNKNQGNIDAMMRNAMTYASPQRIAASMGQAQAGVQQGAEAGRQAAVKDLQSYGIDPSSGRYAALDQASRVMSGAQAAGAGNVQRDRDIATGWGMQTGAQGLSAQNYQTGYGASQAANALLGTAMQLKYPPLGTTATSSTDSSGQGTGFNVSENQSNTRPTGGSGGGTGWGRTSTPLGPGPSTITATSKMPYFAAGGDVPDDRYAADDGTTGGFVSQELSPSSGAQVDDVQARLNTGEFVIPKDVAAWKGQEFFYKLMAQARKMRATAGQENGNGGMGYGNDGEDPSMNGQESAFAPQQSGYQNGGLVGRPREVSELSRDVEGLPGIEPRSKSPSGATVGYRRGNYPIESIPAPDVDPRMQTSKFDYFRPNRAQEGIY